MKKIFSAHFYDPETNKRLVVTDILGSGRVPYLKSIFMIPSKMTNTELVTYFARKLASKAK